jgi:hypothetical protein
MCRSRGLSLVGSLCPSTHPASGGVHTGYRYMFLILGKLYRGCRQDMKVGINVDQMVNNVCLLRPLFELDPRGAYFSQQDVQRDSRELYCE